MCILCHDFKGKHTPYIGLQLSSTVASSSNIYTNIIWYANKHHHPYRDSTTVLSITGEGYYKGVCFSTGVQYVPTIHQKPLPGRLCGGHLTVSKMYTHSRFRVCSPVHTLYTRCNHSRDHSTGTVSKVHIHTLYEYKVQYNTYESYNIIYITCTPANLMDVKCVVLQHNGTMGLISTVGLILSTL